jgi:hypothetical protein
MIRRIFAGIFVFVFIVISLPLITSFGIYKTFLNEDFYKGEFLDVVYEFAIEKIPEQIEWENMPQEIDQEEFNEILKDVFTKDDLLIVIESLIDQVKTVEASEQGIIEMSIPLTWVKEKSALISELIIDNIVDDLEACENKGDFSPDEMNCIPEQVLISDFKDDFKSSFEEDFLKAIPDDYNFNFQIPENTEIKNLSDQFRLLFKNLFFIGILSLLLIFLIIGLIIFRPLIRILKWEAKTLFLASVIPLITFVVLFYGVDLINFSQVDLYMDIIKFFVMSLSQTLIVYLAPFAILFLILWIVCMIFDKNKKHDSS